MALTAKQQAFVDEYLVTLNASDAARKAGYSAKTAAQMGHKLLADPEVAAAIETAKQARSERTQISQDRVLEELAAVAFSDVRDYVAWDGTTVMLKASPDLADARAVASVAGDGEKATLRMHDKIRALEILGKHVGLFKEQSPFGDGPISVEVIWPEQAGE